MEEIDKKSSAIYGHKYFNFVKVALIINNNS